MSNTNRQLHALAGTVGRGKADVLAERVAAINPACDVRVVRDFITAELKVALDTHSNIPVGILVDPVVKQTSPGGQHPGLKRADFELVASMSEHARLEARPALHLLALCLRAALDHTGGENPAQERAIALKAANRTQEAMRVMKRMKLMQEEIQEIDAGAGAG